MTSSRNQQRRNTLKAADPAHVRELLDTAVDQDEQRKQALEAQLLEGLNSGEARPLTRTDFDRVRDYVRRLATSK